MDYNFEWDPQKARANRRKHRVSFEEATTVFLDPRALTVYDEEHGDAENRWITMGLSSVGRLLVVCHTFREESASSVTIRIFSCRKATKNESKHYGAP